MDAPAAANPDLSLNLQLIADPIWVEPGQVVTFTVTARNPAAVPLPTVALTDTLPAGLVYLPDSAAGFVYEPNTRRLVWPAGELAAGTTITGSFQTRVQGLAIGETVTNTVTASSPSLPTPAFTDVALDIVPPGGDETWVTAEQGGVLRSGDDRLLVRVPAGAVAGRTRFTYAARLDLPDLPPEVLAVSELTAHDAAGAPVAAFARPLGLSLRYTESQLQGRVEQSLRLVRLDAASRAALPVASKLDPHGRRLQAEVTEMGLYALAADEAKETYFQPRLEAAQTALLTGDSAFSYNLDVPSGAGGLRLPLTLRYSGSIPNAMAGGYNHDGGWVGVGWTLNVGEIQAVDGQPVQLILDGLSGELTPVQDPVLTAVDFTESDVPDETPGVVPGSTCVYHGDGSNINSGRQVAQ